MDLVEHHESLPHIRHVYMTTYITYILFFIYLKPVGLAEIFHIRFQGCRNLRLILLLCGKIKHRQSKYLTTFSNYPEGNSVLS